MAYPVSWLIAQVVEKFAEKYSEEAFMVIAQRVAEKCSEETIREVAQWALSALSEGEIRQRVVDFICQLGAKALGDKTEEILQNTVPELDEIPNHVAERFSEAELVKIGRRTLDELSAEARRRIRQTGHTSAQVGAAVIMHLSDLADGGGAAARRLKDKLK